MDRAWVTTASTNPESVVNPLIAACEDDYIPDRVYMLTTPNVTETMAAVETLITEILETYEQGDPNIRVTALDAEDDFDAIYAHVKGGIEDAHTTDASVAVDVTPGRKYMTAIAFAAGLRYDADRVHYLYLNPRKRGRLYFELPHTSTTLYDFTEAI